MRFRHALVVGKFAPPHAGHQFLIETALSEADHVTVLCYLNPDFAEMPDAVRAAWISELYPRVTVRIPLCPPLNAERGEVHWEYLKTWLRAQHLEVDAVFSSESYGAPFARALGTGVVHRMVDNTRTKIDVSGTMIRQDIHLHKSWLDPWVYRHFVKRIVFMGAESCGKSTLAQHAARDFGTVFVPEIGRSVWESKAGALSVSDYLDIARAHRAAEDAAILKANRFVFSDTNAITTLLLGFCYGHIRQAPEELVELARLCKTRYAGTFICEDDFPFSQDGWRDDAVWRSRIQGMIRYDLQMREIFAVSLYVPVEQRLRTVRSTLLLAIS